MKQNGKHITEPDVCALAGFSVSLFLTARCSPERAMQAKAAAAAGANIALVVTQTAQLK